MTHKARWWFFAFAAAGLVIFSMSAFADLALMPPIQTQETTNTGAPLAFGKVYTYEPGTTTPKATFLTSAGTTTNTNPVILDSAGRGSIWLNGVYKVKICTATDTQCRTVDNVSASPSLSLSLAQNEFPENTLVTSFLNTTQFSVPGDYTTTYEPGRRIKTVNSGGTYYGNVVTSAYSVGLTTITVLLDSGSLDAGLESVFVGLLSADNHSVPTLPADTETNNFTVNGGHLGRIVSVNSTTPVTATLMNATTVPNGAMLTLASLGTGTVTISGTIDSTLNPAMLYQNEAVTLASNGTATWQVVSQNTTSHANIQSSGTNTWSGTNTFTGPVSFATTTITGFVLPLSTRETFTTSGTWTVPTGVTRAFLFMQGAGGGGGGGEDGAGHGGGGGGAGGHITWYPVDVIAGELYSIVMNVGGSAGAGGIAGSGSDGGSGGTTTFALLTSPTYTVTAGGGGGGQGGQAGVGGGTGGGLGTFSYTPVPSITGDGTVQGDYFRVREWYPATPAYTTSGGAGGTTQGAGGNGGGFGGGIGGNWLHDGAPGPGAVGTDGTGSGGGGGGSNTGAGTGAAGGIGGSGYAVILY
jgi:hypothetical protein